MANESTDATQRSAAQRRKRSWMDVVDLGAPPAPSLFVGIEAPTTGTNGHFPATQAAVAQLD